MILQTVGDLTSAPETGSYITDQRELVDTPYMECFLICPYDLMAIINMDIRKIPYPYGLRSIGPLSKPSMEPLDLGKYAGSYCDLLLVGNGQ